MVIVSPFLCPQISYSIFYTGKLHKGKMYDVNNATIEIFITVRELQKKTMKYPKYVRLRSSDFWREGSKYPFNAAVCPFSFLKTSCNNIPLVCGAAFTENRFADLKTCHTAAQMSETLS